MYEYTKEQTDNTLVTIFEYHVMGYQCISGICFICHVVHGTHFVDIFVTCYIVPKIWYSKMVTVALLGAN